MKFMSELVPPTEPVRRVIIELPEYAAEALADVINNQIIWGDHPVAADALDALHGALLGY